MPFKKGHSKIGGRKRGSQNRFTRTVKETVFEVFKEIQNDPKVNLIAFAKKHPRDFYLIASKLIPSEIVGKDGKDLIQTPIAITNASIDQLQELVKANTGGEAIRKKAGN